jgi:O-antigen/teichoic acid export membrane protein
MIFTGRMISFLQTKLKIDQRFYELSINQMLYGVTAAIFGIMLVYYFSFRGLLISLMIADMICICYLILKEKKLPKVKISFKHYWQLLKIGFPMMILFILLMSLSSVDRTLILTMISEKALGYYGIATVATGVIATIPQAIHSVTIAPIMEKIGRNKKSQSIKNYLDKPMLLLAFLLPILICCLYFSIHIPIKYFLYKYIPSIPVVKILLIGAYFEAVATPSLSIALALNKQIQLIFIVLPVVGLNFVLNFMFIKTGWGLNGVAAGTSISFFVYFCVIQYFAQLQFKENFQVFLKRLFIILVPFGYTLIIIFIINTFIRIEITGFLSDLFSTILRIATFILFYSILIYKMRKQFGYVKLNNNLVSLFEKIKYRIWRQNYIQDNLL